GRRAKASSFALLVGQMVLAIVLLAGAGVMVRSFLNIYFADTGARLAGLNAALIQLPASRYPDGDRRSAFFAGLTDRLGLAPEIRRATLANQLPTGKSRRRVSRSRAPSRSTAIALRRSAYSRSACPISKRS